MILLSALFNLKKKFLKYPIIWVMISISTDSQPQPQASSTRTPPLRRNRRQPACEVCRKQKLACDHALPTCSRCVRKGRSSECYYHPSPMKTDGPRKIRTLRRMTAQRDTASTDPEHILPTPSTTPATVAFSESGTTSNVASTLFTDNHAGPRGPSRPSAIFAENQADLGSGLWDAETEVSDHDYLHKKKGTSIHGTSEDVRSGAKILLALPSHCRCNALVDRYFACFHPMDPILHRPTIEFWHKGLWDFSGESLGEPRDLEYLQVGAQIICKNQLARTDLEIRKSYERWVEAFTGPCLRWETVGILFAICGISCMTYPAWAYRRNPIDETMTRENFALHMLLCCRDCLQICESFGGVNDPRIYLIYLLLTLRFMCGEEGVSRLFYLHVSV